MGYGNFLFAIFYSVLPIKDMESLHLEGDEKLCVYEGLSSHDNTVAIDASQEAQALFAYCWEAIGYKGLHYLA